MHKTNAEAAAFMAEFLPALEPRRRRRRDLPAFTALQTVAEGARAPASSSRRQNMHEAPEGAFTGEVSAPMLIEVGARGVVLGHSERRQLFGETDAALARKVPAALAAGLLPILCVGETESERDAGETEPKLRTQIQTDLAAVPAERLRGRRGRLRADLGDRHGRNATPDQAQQAVAFVRALIADRDRKAAERIRVLYGGSVKAANAAELLGQPDVDGALVGGASLDPHEFARIVAAAPPRDDPADPLPAVVVVVLDGWGLAPPGPGNAISLAATPVFDGLWERYPHTELQASGRAVGLPEGQMGNSEVGHLNLGAGTVVRQDLVRIDDAIADGSFFENEALRPACAAARESGRLHLIGLVREEAFTRAWTICVRASSWPRESGCPSWCCMPHGRSRHPADQRAGLPGAGRGVAGAAMGKGTAARIATAGGRYWGMDRDRRWDRTNRAYDSIVHARGEHAGSAAEAVEAAYARGETDEFIAPTVIGAPAPVRPGEPAIISTSGRTGCGRSAARSARSPRRRGNASRRGPRPYRRPGALRAPASAGGTAAEPGRGRAGARRRGRRTCPGHGYAGDRAPRPA